MIARVISRLGTQFLILADGQITPCVSRKKLSPLAVGDWVEWQKTSDNEGVIDKIIKRKNLLTRPDALNHFDKPVAANLDLILVVVASKPEPDLSLVDEYLVLAQYYDLEVEIVHNKMDLPNSAESLKRLDEYKHLGYQIIATQHNTTLDSLKQCINNKTCVFLGQSGVGKTSLINGLLPDKNLRVQILSDKSQGKHTTSHSTLYPLESGGEIIDSPGIREFGLWKLHSEDIQRGFIEISQYGSDCRFNNCRHQKEPQCAVKKAVEEQQISSRRYQHFQKLLANSRH